MLNRDLCAVRDVEGATIGENHFGQSGHAVWGPYISLPRGDYRVLYRLSIIDPANCADEDVVAVIDVAIDYARNIAATKTIKAGELRSDMVSFPIEFSLDSRAVAEFRIWVNGNARLAFESYCPCFLRDSDESQFQFPATGGNSPAIFAEHSARFRHLFERGFGVSFFNNNVVMIRDGIKFFAKELDDLNLIGEIFLQQVYRVERSKSAVVIDIGMNIGLVSMQFAKNPAVERVYSFEPFESTFKRAHDNLALNPGLSRKVFPINAGVSDVDGQVTFNVFETSDSGARSTRNAEGCEGVPTQMSMRSAATVVRDIRRDHPGSDLIIKVDCEGAEFAIFETLARAGLFPEISVMMVEWHAIFPGKGQVDLIQPLVDNGFTIFDRSPETGNGFFYAVR